MEGIALPTSLGIRASAIKSAAAAAALFSTSSDVETETQQEILHQYSVSCFCCEVGETVYTLIVVCSCLLHPNRSNCFRIVAVSILQLLKQAVVCLLHLLTLSALQSSGEGQLSPPTEPHN
jgi:hypothetical protein